ncbi:MULTISPECIES: hypothetical protein [unclassified Crossiella]|uniref:hypothetical protein n=1 Tax=unclassified Crossiella TaxID=2620835 RepID=UPI001FFEF2AF|nr:MULTISPECIES: hypothetical protein [unclassified Crossiella]MCK2240769.1 hypothetical protein [Crossiella sp. S99.2]MCK2254087.1 hypothetical protein [Crossiella sp. S99.1]
MTRTLVWDASALHHAVLAARLDVVGDLARGPDQEPWRNVTTATVRSEMRRNGLDGTAPWLETVHVDELDEIRALFTWRDRQGATSRDHGETTVCAWAEVHGATAVIDDRAARRTARRHGLHEVHGSLWVFAQGVRSGRATAGGVAGLVNALIATGARYPCQAIGFEAWARQNKLLV